MALKVHVGGHSQSWNWPFDASAGSQKKMLKKKPNVGAPL
jgi:hypothetical protein